MDWSQTALQPDFLLGVFWGFYRTPESQRDRSAIRGGLYLSHVPKIPKLDLRMEGVYTDVPAGGALSHGFYYFNFRFKEGYTNDGQLLGSWIGRQGRSSSVGKLLAQCTTHPV
jgi:hypothetical protein